MPAYRRLPLLIFDRGTSVPVLSSSGTPRPRFSKAAAIFPKPPRHTSARRCSNMYVRIAQGSYFISTLPPFHSVVVCLASAFRAMIEPCRINCPQRTGIGYTFALAQRHERQRSRHTLARSSTRAFMCIACINLQGNMSEILPHEPCQSRRR